MCGLFGIIKLNNNSFALNNKLINQNLCMNIIYACCYSLYASKINISKITDDDENLLFDVVMFLQARFDNKIIYKPIPKEAFKTLMTTSLKFEQLKSQIKNKLVQLPTVVIDEYAEKIGDSNKNDDEYLDMDGLKIVYYKN